MKRDDSPCDCSLCQDGAKASENAWHCQFKALLLRLPERERRWTAALEALRLGHGGIRRVSQISGLDEKTIRRGRRELQQGLEAFPSLRVRAPGAGRKVNEKKGPRSKSV